MASQSDTSRPSKDKSGPIKGGGYLIDEREHFRRLEKQREDYLRKRKRKERKK